MGAFMSNPEWIFAVAALVGAIANLICAIKSK